MTKATFAGRPVWLESPTRCQFIPGYTLAHSDPAIVVIHIRLKGPVKFRIVSCLELQYRIIGARVLVSLARFSCTIIP